MDIVDVIVSGPCSDGEKLVKLYSVVMLNYRQELGDKAWNEISKLFKDEGTISGFAFLTGLLSGWNGEDAQETFGKFIKKEMEIK